MSRSLVLYEDALWPNLSPLADLIPVPALRFGASTIAERWREIAGVPLLAIEAREGALATWRERPTPDAARPADDVLVLNAAALPGPWLDTALVGPKECLFVRAGRVAGARVPFARLESGLGRGAAFEPWLLSLGLPSLEVDVTFLAWPWDLVAHNAAAIVEDLSGWGGQLEGEIHPLVGLTASHPITVEPDARIEPFAVLDSREGPILVERGALVGPHTVVIGPCVVGAGTQLLGGLVARSTIGPGCRIAGEVDDSVWQGWANKRHHGFVGHSAIGEWVNLGALTTTSDLKNNYGEVRAWAGGRERETGLTKVGSFVGDHVKTGIGTLLPTGASIGAGSLLFGGGRFAPKRLASFSWWDGERAVEHRFDAFLATAGHAMARRERPLRAADETALRALFEAGAAERGGAPATAAARS